MRPVLGELGQTGEILSPQYFSNTKRLLLQRCGEKESEENQNAKESSPPPTTFLLKTRCFRVSWATEFLRGRLVKQLLIRQQC